MTDRPLEGQAVMKLRTKILLVTGVLLTGLIVSGPLLFNRSIRSSFRSLEERESQKDLLRVYGAINQELLGLEGPAVDWANWDPLYDYMRSRDPGFAGENFSANTFQNLRLDLAALVDDRGETLQWWRSAPPDAPGERERLLASLQGITPPYTGLLDEKGRIWFLAVRPVLTTRGEGPPRGWLAFGRRFDSALLRRLKAACRVDFLLEAAGPVREGEGPILLEPRHPDPDLSRFAMEADQGQLVGRCLLADLTGRQAIRLVIRSSREVFAEARWQLWMHILQGVWVAILLSGIILLLLERTLFVRLSRVAGQLDQITHLDDLSLRIREQGRDELGELAVHVNDLLARLEKAHNTLLSQTAKLQEARAKAVEASHQKSLFLANVSHEIRTPMTAILGFTELLRDPALTPQESLDYLDTIQRNGNHLLQLLNDILDLSRVEADSLRLEPEPLALPEVLDEVAENLRPQAAAKNLRLEVICEPGAPGTIECDRTRLRQILLNLGGNAVKFTERGAVTLRLTAGEGDQARLEVIDTGVGIADKDLPRLFQPFSQVNSEFNRRHGGTGLGLALCRKLVHAMGGRIGVATVQGEGSTFWVLLPLKPPTPPEVGELSAAANGLLP